MKNPEKIPERLAKGTACIYYPNEFDSVPHSFIIKTLDIYKVSPVIIEMGMSTKLINTFSNVW